MKYDIFLSYKSEDRKWVEGLKKSLKDRGVSVWLDKDNIRPGDLFAEALEEGIMTSKTVAVIVTPNSLKSKWVQEEYYRALSLSKTKGTNIVPCILRSTDVPGFLSSRQYIDFSDSTKYEYCVDKLVCPGITGKWIKVESFTGDLWHHDWEQLDKCAKKVLGFTIRGGCSSSRMNDFLTIKRSGVDVRIYYQFAPNDRQDSVVLLDMTLHGVSSSVEFILECRNSNDGIYDKIIFVFYHSRDLLSNSDFHGMSKDLVDRFSHYYVIEKSSNMLKLKQNVRRTWNNVLQDLVRAARRNKP